MNFNLNIDMPEARREWDLMLALKAVAPMLSPTGGHASTSIWSASWETTGDPAAQKETPTPEMDEEASKDGDEQPTE